MLGNRPKILIVDDERLNIQMLDNLLKDDYDISVAINGEQAMQRASYGKPDIILLDIQMPVMNGYELCEKLKVMPETRDIPVMFISGKTEEADEKKGLELGAVDYITKPFRPAIVLARIKNHLELKRQRDALARLSSLDGLTGIPNRRQLDELLEREWNRARRSNAALGFIILDIDHFKPYNDNYGHVAGDQCLKEIARTITNSMERATDFAARYGGEEFACILPDTDLDGALKVANKLCEDIRSLDIPHAFSDAGNIVTASFGVACAIPGDGKSSVDDLIKTADTLLFEAKNRGRNRVAYEKYSLQPEVAAKPEETKKKPRLLIADDEAINIGVLNAILKDHCEISVAMNGEQALKLAESELRPDMILLDIQMPEMTGYDVIRKLKANPALCDIPVFFITVLSDEHDEKKGLELGAVDYISKPFHPSVVMARIKTHLRLKQTLEELAKRNLQLEDMLNLRESVERITKHDLKSPIGAIISMTEILMDENDIPPRHYDVIRMIAKSGYNILDMINRSFDIWKMERGTYPYSPTPVDMAHVIRRIIQELDMIKRKKRVTVKLIIDGRPASNDAEFFVKGEEWLFYSMLANLIKNAVEAAPDENDVTVAIEHNDGVVINIHNAGAVPVEVRGNFFEKYVTFGKKSGTGLGTYVAALVVKVLGGAIKMETSEDKGTTVTVHLTA